MRQKSSATRNLERVIIAFFALVALSLVIVYLADPSMYTSTFLLPPSPTERYSWPTTLLILAILAFLVVLVIGVMRHWYWLFWLLLLAFGFAILEIPATLLQWASILPAFPGPFPLWYSLYRVGIALAETGIAVYMLQVYRHSGVWGLKTPEKDKDHDQI